MSHQHSSLVSDSDYEVDEKLLIDFHLGNAINLDIIDYVVTGKDPGYTLFVPEYYIDEYSKLRNILPSVDQVRVGFLECTSDILSLPSMASRFSPWVYKRIIKIISSGLQSKGIKIPFTKFEDAIVNHTVTIRAIYERVFRRLLRGISMLSEILRGGTSSVYTDVEIVGNHVVVDILDDHGTVTAYIGRNVSAIYSKNSKTLYVGNYDSVLLVLDTIGQRICLEIGCQITRITKTPGSIPKDVLEITILLGDQILRAAGNKGYEVIALFEASVVSALLKSNPDPVSDSSMFYDNCMRELSEICEDEEWGNEVESLWIEMIDMLCSYTPEMLSNIFCIYRIWGHPRVDILAGMSKVYKKGMLKKHTTKAASQLVICQFRRMFLNAYLAKSRQYPPLVIPSDDTYVYRRLRSGLPIDRNTPGFCIWDYSDVKICQIWNLPSTYDICHILNDKAVSPNRSEIYRSIQDGNGTISGVNRRGIIRWMEGESIRCKEFLEKVNDHGLDLDSLIIGMYEKEREIKVQARMFSLMSEEMRMYFVLTEELIANHILPYFPEITMKDPLHIQLRKIWSIGGKGQHPLNPNINIDFEKWNLNMRHEFTKDLFEQLDIMFGFSSLISRTHEIFKASYIYSSSGKYLPSVDQFGLKTDPPMAYIGHLGGFEGLRQKGWTLATVCLLAYIAESMSLEMCLLGQGDNQVLKLYMPVAKWSSLCYTYESSVNEARKLTQEFTHQMRINFSDAGLPIKIRETWISTRLFMYGKTMYLDGNSLPQWSKKLLRSYALSNEGSITTSGIIGTIATNMSAASGASIHPDIMYILYLIMSEWSLEYLLSYHPFTRKTIRPEDRISFLIPGYNNGKEIKSPRMNYFHLVSTLLTVPTSVGGSVTIPMTSFIMRGFPDHASEGYSWIKMLASVESPLKIMYENWYSFMQNTTIQPDMLIQSPWSLNHLKPPTPGLQSRELVRNWLLSGRFKDNRFLKNMSQLNQFFDRKRVCSELLSDPMNPLISYEVYQGFPHSYYDSILRRFEGTRSVKKLAMRESQPKPIVKKLMKVEHHYMGYLIWRMNNVGRVFSSCATKHTRMCRDIGWGRHIIGLTTPHPLEFLFDKICTGLNAHCDGDDHIYLRYDPDGNNPPYLGSKVKTKVVSQQDEGARSEPLICTNARIARYINWLGVGKNLKGVVEKATRIVCDIDIYDRFFDEDPYGEMYSGSIEHRFNPSAASEGCFINYSPQIGSMVMMSSDHMPKFGKGKANYTLHFQALYCFLQYIGANLEDRSSLHYHLCCNDCIIPVEEKIGDIDLNHPGIDLAFDDRVIPVIRETIGEIKEKTVVILTPPKISIPGDYVLLSDEIEQRNKAYYGTIMLLSVKCTLSLFVRGYRQTEGLGAEDLQSFPRVYAYKIHVDHMLWTISRMLIYLQAIHSKESINGETLYHLKRRVNKVLMNSPLSKFKDVASLCIGRSFSENNWISVMNLSQGVYPETTTSFLRLIKHILINEIEYVGVTDRSFPKNIIIPALNCSNKEHQMIIGYLASIYGCGICMELPQSEDSEVYADCRSLHLRSIIRGVKLVNTTLDRFVKVMSVKRSIKAPTQWSLNLKSSSAVAYTKRYEHKNVTNIVSSVRNQRIRELRSINLPTASTYKWSNTFSQLQIRPDIVIIFGDGTGSTSYIAAHVFPSAKIFPCAFIEGKRCIPQDLESIRPSISRHLKNVNGALQEALPDDVTKPEWGYQFRDALSKMSGTVLIVTDLESAGGSWGVTQHIFENTLENTFILSKLYGSEIDSYCNYKFPSDCCILFSNQDANVQYGEYFLYLQTYQERNILNIHESLTQLYDQINKEDLRKNQLLTQIDIENTAHDLRVLSKRLTFDHISSKGLSIAKGLIKEGSMVTLGAVMNFINSRYRFPQDKIRMRDVRNLSDGNLDRLVKGLKIVILSMFKEEILKKDWFKGLYLARCSRNNRLPGLYNWKIIPVFDRFGRVEMDHKDIGSARTLRCMFGCNNRDPEDEIEFMQCYVIPAAQIDQSLYLHSIDAISDTVETLSDLSHTTVSEE